MGWGLLGGGVQTRLFYEDPLYCLPPPPFFFIFCQTLPPTSMSPPIPTPTVLSVIDNMDLLMASLDTLALEGS